MNSQAGINKLCSSFCWEDPEVCLSEDLFKLGPFCFLLALTHLLSNFFMYPPRFTFQIISLSLSLVFGCAFRELK